MEELINNQQKTLGNIVAEDYRTAAILKKFGIDFCCQGNRSLEQACVEKSLSSKEILSEINKLPKAQSDNAPKFTDWPLDLLVDYIEKKHHRYVESAIIELKPYLAKICSVHGQNHPELFELQNEFNECSQALLAHMKKEEMVLFPWIRKMTQQTAASERSNVASISAPITQMMEEHSTEGDRFRRINELTQNYTPPADACGTYTVTYELLKAFENDLHLHIHLENNILFPRAQKME